MTVRGLKIALEGNRSTTANLLFMTEEGLMWVGKG